jgi:outer membrane lipoprotein-sorting protein
MLQLDPSAKTELLPSRALCYKVLALSRSRSMRKLIVAVILLFASICPMQAQTLDEIVSKHLDAMGGAGRLRAVQTMSMERVGVDPSKKTDTFAILRKRGNKFRMETTTLVPQSPIKIRTIEGCDGKNFWIVSAAGKTMLDSIVADKQAITPADETCKIIAEIDSPLLDYKTKKDRLTLAGIQKVADSDAYDLQLNNSSKHVAAHFYVDKKSFLLVKVVRESDGSHTEDLYSNYRKVDGMMVPFLWETRWWAVRKDPALEKKAASAKIAGEEGSNKEIVKSVKFNIPLPDSLFAPPSATPGKKSPQAAKK